ncbi:MAG: Tol-Pal system beta propeller repeat protein TolB, partial [Gammaproteobacteria bacterium]|nr:Tol-Pal system beta propeller repeat protein TolB [Gammaproteobacteria bacterium]
MKQLVRIVSFMWLAALATSAHGVLKVEITQGAVGALPIAVVPFELKDGASTGDNDTAQIIETDLQLTGRFKALGRGSMLEKPGSSEGVDYQNWRILNMDFLVVGNIKPSGNGGYIYQFELLDVFKQERLAAYNIPVAAGQERAGAHYISDLIYEKILGERGAFNTNIAYVSVNQIDGGLQYILNVADIDGANPRPVTRSTEPLMSPSWSPDGQQLAYVSFEKGRSAIYVQDLRTGKRTLVSREEGINGAPVFSPDGSRIALTLSSGGNIDIWLHHIASGRKQRLTRNPGIDTEPAFSPDGNTLAFTSNRGGGAQIYQMDLKNNRIQRLTFEGKENLRARYSPDGKKLTLV